MRGSSKQPTPTISWTSAIVVVVACLVPRSSDAADPPLQPLEIHRIRGHNSKMIIGADFSPDGKLLATAGWDGLVRLWDPVSGKEVAELAGHTKVAYHVAFRADGKRLISGGNSTLRLWDPETGQELRNMRGHISGLTHLAFTPDGNGALSGSYDGTVRLWDLHTGKSRVLVPRVDNTTTYALAVSPTQPLLAVGLSDGTITLWDLDTGDKLRDVQKVGGNVWKLHFSPDGRMLASADQNASDSLASLWEVSTGQLRCQLAESNSILSVAFSPDGRLLAGGGQGGEVKLWDAGSGRLLSTVGKHEAKMVPTVEFSPDGRTLVSVGHDGTIRLWKVNIPLPTEKPKKLSAQEVSQCWEQLASHDAALAYRAIVALRQSPQTALPFLRAHLRPLPTPRKIDSDLLAQWIRDLDADNFQTREEATQALQKAGLAALEALQQALPATTSLEARRRLKALLARLKPGTLSPEQRCILRAVEVLEHCQAPQATAFLNELARGSPDNLLTREARHVQNRLARSSSPSLPDK
jgi:dipeptidyl aminopeptidase/acylaminoacyl peptidase